MRRCVVLNCGVILCISLCGYVGIICAQPRHITTQPHFLDHVHLILVEIVSKILESVLFTLSGGNETFLLYHIVRNEMLVATVVLFSRLWTVRVVAVFSPLQAQSSDVLLSVETPGVVAKKLRLLTWFRSEERGRESGSLAL